MGHPTKFELSQLVDDDLSDERTGAVERHLDGCEACRGYYAALVEIGRRARRLGNPEPPDIADEVIRRRAEAIGSP